MRILVTGSKGQLGSEILHCLSTMRSEIGAIPIEYEGAQVDSPDSIELDISDFESVKAWFRLHDVYDLVINCAAVTNVDGCEKNEEAAFAVNAKGPANLAKACASTDAKFIQVSTDYVFPGDEPGERVESDPVGPLSAYGRSKLAGEKSVMDACPRSFVVRTAWLYGYAGHNFVKTMLRLGRTHDRIAVVNDQFGNPTSANDLAYEILKIALTEDYGIFHCTNNGTCSWADFAAAIMDGANLDCEVVPITSAEYKAANLSSADRPKFSSLKNEHLAMTVGDEMRPWEESLAEYLGNLSKSEG